ncbi:unnamed protein product [Closterium sp. Naga37s-1]|nr:unnamed protein product [Closterium sp. Naga37s-1]
MAAMSTTRLIPPISRLNPNRQHAEARPVRLQPQCEPLSCDRYQVWVNDGNSLNDTSNRVMNMCYGFVAGIEGIADEEIGGLENNWDLIVMMGCLPNLPKVDLPASTTEEDWGLPDPAAHPELMDSVIEKIVEKVKAI